MSQTNKTKTLKNLVDKMKESAPNTKTKTPENQIKNANRKKSHSNRKHKTPTKTGKEIVDLVSKAIGKEKPKFDTLRKLVNHFYTQIETKPESTKKNTEKFYKDVYCFVLKIQIDISKNISKTLKVDKVNINYRVILAALISPRRENESNQLKIVRAGIRKNKEISKRISVGRRFIKHIYPGHEVDCGTKLKH